MSVKGARLRRASRSDGEAALDPQRPARQRLAKRFRASPDRIRSGALRAETDARTGGCVTGSVQKDNPRPLQRPTNGLQILH